MSAEIEDVIDRGDDFETPFDGDLEGTDLPEPPKDGAAEVDEPASKDKDIRIPKSRFDAAQAKARERERELLDRLEQVERGRIREETSVNLSAHQDKLEELRNEYEEHLIEGERDAARRVRAQITSMEREVFEYSINEKSDSARRAAIEDLRYDEALDRTEKTFPVLDPRGDQYDEEVVNEVAELMGAFIGRGATRQAAMERAVRYVLGNAEQTSAKAPAQTTRAELARRSAAKAAASQPQSLGIDGEDHDMAGIRAAKSVDRMSDKAFREMSEEELARARGDII